jgi:hypothetical protein
MVKANTADTNPDGGGGGLQPGKYHFLINKVEVEERQKQDWEKSPPEDVFDEHGEPVMQPTVVVTWEVLAGVLAKSATGTIDDMVEKNHKEYFNLGGKATGRFFQLCAATDVYSKEQWKVDRESGVEVDIDETELDGRQFFGEIQLEEQKTGKNKGQKFPRIGFRIWHPFHDHGKVKDIPRNEEMFSMLTPPEGYEEGTSSNGTKAAPSRTSPNGSKATPPAAGAKQSKFSNV